MIVSENYFNCKKKMSSFIENIEKKVQKLSLPQIKYFNMKMLFALVKWHSIFAWNFWANMHYTLFSSVTLSFDAIRVRTCFPFEIASESVLKLFHLAQPFWHFTIKAPAWKKKFSSAPAQKFWFVCMWMCVSKRKILLAMQERERENGKRRKKLFSPLVDWILRNFKISLKPLFELHFQSTLLSY